MRIYLTVIIGLFMMACSSETKKEGELIVENKKDSTTIVAGPVLAKAEKHRFYMPAIFTHTFKEDVDVSVDENFLSVDEGQLVAKKYWYNGQEITAITFAYMSPDQNMMRNASHVLGRNENGDIVDLMDAVFPEIDVYAFYSFKDKALKQLEGDEQTVFAGYKLDLSKDDSLGVQFMFCNKKDEADTDSLNKDGVVRYVALEEF